MMRNKKTDSMPRSVSSSPINSEASNDINDDEDDISSSPKLEPSSPQIMHQNGSINSSKPSKLSFSISRLLSAKSGCSKHTQNSPTPERESESPSLCFQCPPTDNNATVASYSPPTSSESKFSITGPRMTMSSYEMALNYLSGAGAAHQTMAYNSHYPWLGPTPPNIIKDGLQSKSSTNAI